MNFSFQSEYAVLAVFVLGMAVHALIQVRRPDYMLGTGALFLGAAVLGWFMAEEDPAWEVPVFVAWLFPFSFAIAFRKVLLPFINSLILLYLTVLFYYALYLSWRASGVGSLPTSMLVVFALPGTAILAAMVFGLFRFRFVKIAGYVWYLIALAFLIVSQLKVEDVQALTEGNRFPPGLYVYAFFAGAAVMYLMFHLVQVLLLVPIGRNRAAHRMVFDAIFGPKKGGRETLRDAWGPLDTHNEQAALMAQRFRESRHRLIWVAAIVVYAVLLAGNAYYEWLRHGILINISLLAVIWGDAFRHKETTVTLHAEPAEPKAQVTETAAPDSSP